MANPNIQSIARSLRVPFVGTPGGHIDNVMCWWDHAEKKLLLDVAVADRPATITLELSKFDILHHRMTEGDLITVAQEAIDRVNKFRGLGMPLRLSLLKFIRNPRYEQPAEQPE